MGGVHQRFESSTRLQFGPLDSRLCVQFFLRARYPWCLLSCSVNQERGVRAYTRTRAGWPYQKGHYQANNNFSTLCRFPVDTVKFIG